jgi:cytoskeleton protein RodZ
LSDTQSDIQEFSASSPGMILRRCREFHQISIDEAAEATKIGSNYLVSLESDRISDFSSIAYLKGFLRIYSSYLSLNADDMVRLFERLYENEEVEQNNRKGLSGEKGARQRKWFSWQKLALPAVLLLLLIVTAAVMERSSAPLQKPQQVPQVDQAQTPVPAAVVQPVLSSAVRPVSRAKLAEEAEQKKDVARVETAVEQKEPSRPPAEASKPFFVRMKVLQGSKLAVTIDGAATQSYDLSSGDIIEWKASNSIALELSNPGGVEAELDGKPLRSFGPPGKPAYVVIGAEGIR